MSTIAIETGFSPALKLPAPVFELRGALARIDLSAWLSGATLGLGLLLIGPSVVLKDLAAGGTKLSVVAAAYVAFLVSVLLIQRHMRLAMTATTFGAPRQLVTGGIFRWSRNPIYVAFLLPLASLGAFSTTPAVLSVLAYIFAMNLTVIRKEERDLLAAFGPAYVAFAVKVPRWVF